jgi:AhpD family alkylhydroperoxidase
MNAILNAAMSRMVLIMRPSGLFTDDFDYHVVPASMVIPRSKPPPRAGRESRRARSLRHRVGDRREDGVHRTERNIVYIAILYANECAYCTAGHTNLSRMVKVEPEAITAVRDGRPRWCASVLGRGVARGEPYSNRPTVTEEGKKILFGRTSGTALVA